MGFVFTLAFPLWLFIIVSRIFSNLNRFRAKFLPEGAPSLLNPFLSVVELVSVLVRLLTLCRGYCNEAFNINLLERVFKITPFILGLVNVFYLIFELFICLIQVYIFCILLLLYSEEHSRSVSGLFTVN